MTTFAGSGTSAVIDGTGVGASFQNPQGIATDSSGNVYVGDSTMIRKISSASVVTTFVGSATAGYQDGTGTNAKFAQGWFMCFSPDGNLYFIDNNNVRVRKVTMAAVVTTVAGQGIIGTSDGIGTNAKFSSDMWGCTADTQGNLFVANHGSNTVRKIASAASSAPLVTTLAFSNIAGNIDGTGTAAELNGPSDIAADTNGNLFVTMSAGNSVRRITPAGSITTLAGSLSGTAGYADGLGTAALFICNNNYCGMSIDSSAVLYVLERGPGRIRRVTPAGGVTTVAGSTSGGFSDGVGTAALFNSPVGLVVSADGNFIYVAEYNYRVRSVLISSSFANGEWRFHFIQHHISFHNNFHLLFSIVVARSALLFRPTVRRQHVHDSELGYVFLVASFCSLTAL